MQCRDLYAVDGVDTTFYIAAEDGFVYKSAMIPINSPEESMMEVNVYPNPASETVCIEGIEAAEVQVYNALGQLMKTVKDSNEINVAGLPEGVCLLRIADAEGRSYMVRVIVKDDSPRR